MMSAPPKKLVPFGTGAAIPQALRAQKRWSPWRAAWNVKRMKWDKVPVDTRQPERGLSTANPDRWYTYDEALKCYNKERGSLAGLGYVLTRPHGIVGVDLDGCVIEGVVDEWAQEIVERLGGYAEFSPSGKGLRIFIKGEIDADWTNHNVGVEVYSGHTPRFLTVTGRHLPGTPLDVHPPTPGALEWLTQKYRENHLTKKARGDVPALPLLLDESELPVIEELGLPPRALGLLTQGPDADADRSRVLHSTAVALFGAGLDEVQVLSLLATNPFTLEIALDHRRQQFDRAVDYLWEHHVQAGKGKAASRMLTADDFETLESEFTDSQDDAPVAQPTGQATGEGADMFEDISDEVDDTPAAPPKKKADKFALYQAQTYAAQTTTLAWLVPNVLPRAELVSVFGESGAGKTFFVLDMAVRLSAGLPWWGKVLNRHKVVYVAAEGAMGVRLRLQAMAMSLGVNLNSLGLWIMPSQPNILEAEDVRGLVRAIKALGPVDMVILDTIAQVTPGANENSSEDMGKALKHCKTLHEVLGATICLVGHSGKDAARGQRGWSGLKGAMDAQIEVIRTSTYRCATVAKLKDGIGEGDEYLFKLINVELEFDIDDTLLASSCVIEPILNVAQKTAAEKEAVRAKAGRKKATGKWAGYNAQALEALCGPSNKPAHLTQVVNAVKAALEAEGALPERWEFEAKRARKTMVDCGEVIYDEATGCYTLLVPPEAPTAD